MTEIANFQKGIIRDGIDKGSAFAFPNTVYNAAGGYLSIATGIKGYNVTIANGFQSGLQSVCAAAGAIMFGNDIKAAKNDKEAKNETSEDQH